MRRLNPATPTFRAVTFNVLIGSPFPAAFVGRFAANLGSAAGALRQQQQHEHVAAAAADIVCLQELHDCRVTRSYGAAFAASHMLVTGSHFNARGFDFLARRSHRVCGRWRLCVLPQTRRW